MIKIVRILLPAGVTSCIYPNLYRKEYSFFRTVKEKNNQQVYMQQSNNSWIIADTATIPDWLNALEEAGEKAIAMHQVVLDSMQVSNNY